jgi:carbon monoxide dehydrogenase subunit G
MGRRTGMILLFGCLAIAVIVILAVTAKPAALSFQDSVYIERSPADVFAFVSDVRNDPQWHEDIPHAEMRGSGPIGVGTIFDIQGIGKNTTYTLQSYDPPRSVVQLFRVYGLSVTITVTVEPQANGALVTRRVNTPVNGLIARVLQPTFGAASRDRRARFLASLKRVLERPESAS